MLIYSDFSLHCCGGNSFNKLFLNIFINTQILVVLSRPPLHHCATIINTAEAVCAVSVKIPLITSKCGVNIFKASGEREREREEREEGRGRVL